MIENGYLCLKNGIMDQSVCLAAGARCLTLVDCVSRAISHAPLPPALPAGAPVLECALWRPDHHRNPMRHGSAEHVQTQNGWTAPDLPWAATLVLLY